MVEQFTTCILKALDNPTTQLPIRFHLETIPVDVDAPLVHLCHTDSAGAPALVLSLEDVLRLLKLRLVQRGKQTLHYVVEHEAVRRYAQATV